MKDQDSFENYYGPSDIVAKLKNNIVKSVWDTIGMELLEDLKTSDEPVRRDVYWEFNRRLSDILDSFIELFLVRTSIKGSDMEPKYADLLKKEQLHKMSRIISDEIVKTPFITYSQRNEFNTGETVFEITVPFLRVTAKDKG